MFLENILVLAVTISAFMHRLHALQVISPSADTDWSLSHPNTITWSSVASDPSSFSIALVNNHANCAPTGWSQVIQQNVSTADGKYQIGPVSSVKECGGYQINLIAANNGILAQSAPFNVSDATSAPQANSTGYTSTLVNSTSSSNSSVSHTLGGNATNATSKASNGSTPRASTGQSNFQPTNQASNTAQSANSAALKSTPSLSLFGVLALSAIAYVI